MAGFSSFFFFYGGGYKADNARLMGGSLAENRRMFEPGRERGEISRSRVEARKARARRQRLQRQAGG